MALSNAASFKPAEADALAKRCLLLVEVADEAIATYPYAEVPDYWRQLYMDASLLHCVAVLRSNINVTPTELVSLVKVLDKANIVSAFFASERDRVFFAMMAHVQERLKSTDIPSNDTGSRRPTKRARLLSETLDATRHPRNRLIPNVQEIRRYAVSDAPQMYEDFAHAPFVVTGGASHWPALADVSRRWQSEEYLLGVAGRGRIVPVEIGSSYTSEGWSQKLMDFGEFLRDIHWQDHDLQHRDENKSKLYLAQHDLFQQLPQLRNDIALPDYVLASPGAPIYFPEYTPPNTQDGYICNAWMGPEGTYSPAHTDPYFNCYAQVVGSKHIWIAPPACSPFMAVPDGDSQQLDEASPEVIATVNTAMEHFLDNTASLDVFQVANEATLEKHNPRAADFVEHVLPYAMQAILSEGDLLFMPPKWWHAIKSLEPSFSVSIWF
ncbi:hypothetical protein EMMF5_005380 [Cystobasidiomycetes sp. EMM_F5]